MEYKARARFMMGGEFYDTGQTVVPHPDNVADLKKSRLIEEIKPEKPGNNPHTKIKQVTKPRDKQARPRIK